MTGTGQWRTRGSSTIQKRNKYSHILLILYLRLENIRLILSHHICFALSMKDSMKDSNNT